MENEEEELASESNQHWEKDNPTHNSSRIESRNEFQQTFQNMKKEEETLYKTKTGRLDTNLKQGRFSHLTENSSEESEEEEEKQKNKEENQENSGNKGVVGGR